MNLVATTITIAGTAHADSSAGSSGITVDGWGWDLDAADLSADFREDSPALTAASRPTYHGGQTVTVTAAGVTVFTGEIASVSPTFGPDGWGFAYRCRGPRTLINRLAVTATDGTGTMLFNMPADDDAYIPALTARSVGQIVSAVLTRHAAALTAAGFATDATTTSQLAALTLVPVDTVYLTGKLFDAIETVFKQWAKNVVPFVGADGLWRFIDTTNGTNIALTEGTDPVLPVRYPYDMNDVYTRVVYRGMGDIRPWAAKMSTTYVDGLGATQHLLKWAQTSPLQAAWTELDFTQPKDAYDEGTVTVTNAANSVTLHSTDATRAAPLNFWGDRLAWLHLYNSAGTGLTFSEAVPVTASTVQTPGSDFTVTTGVDLQNAGAHAYQTWKLIGGSPALGAGGNDRVDVWRLLTVNDPGGLVSGHLVKSFPTEVGFVGYYGDSTVGTRVPIVTLVNAQGQQLPPVDFDIVPQTGQIRLRRPAVEATTNAQNLSLGGSHVTAPADVAVLLAYSRGALTATYPPDAGGLPRYAGTAYTLFGLQRTLTVDVDSWVYAGNQAQFQALAQMHHRSICDVPFAETVKVLGPLPACFSPTSGTPNGFLLGLGGTSYTTGQESPAVPVRAYRLDHVSDGDGGVSTVSGLRVSARRNPATGDRYYAHPTTMEQLKFHSPLDQVQETLNPAAGFAGLGGAVVAPPTGPAPGPVSGPAPPFMDATGGNIDPTGGGL